MSLETEGSDKLVGVLIVDDDRNLLILTDSIISGFQDYRTTALNDPTKVIPLVKQHPNKFSIVVTDLEMPQMDGITLATQIREVKPETVIIIASGRPFEDVKKLDPMGVMDLYIPKPSLMKDWQKILDEGQRIYRNRIIQSSNLIS